MSSPEPFVMEPHNFVKTKCLPWLLCVKCGLVRLRNPFTDWSVKHGCNNEDHPSYRSVMCKLTSLDGAQRRVK